MEADITDLRNKLKECEKERLKAAQYDLQLLERQTELQSQLVNGFAFIQLLEPEVKKSHILSINKSKDSTYILVRISIAVMKHYDQKQLEEERIDFILQLVTYY
ncbi:hypothetical protein STEG23_004465 [Scotinomys teguina]